ncbi:tellurite resistance TerB family protein [Rhodobacter sp. NSM]|uniref:tellurite resistance TerB family protein n=1 Tax=Rhodobacter sp. NSM TaxID=3457501 RepID=UPI003FD38351
MSLKKVLGLMLASRMAGRGGRAGGLGSAAVLGSSVSKKAGLAALAYMAYRAWQDNQSRTHRSGASGSGSIGGMIGGVIDNLTGQGGHSAGNAQATQHDVAPDQSPEDMISDAKALLLLQGMVAAAWADGAISMEERRRIVEQLDAGGADDDDRRLVEREIAHPQPLDRLLERVRDQETAEQFYLASRAAVDPTTSANRAYLCTLRGRLNLSDAEVREVEDLTA